MKKQSFIVFEVLLISVIVSFVVIGCNKNTSPTTPVEDKSMADLNVPDYFNFETANEVTINFQDNLKVDDTARYKIYLHSGQVHPDTIVYINEDDVEETDYVNSPDPANSLIATKVSTTGTFSLIVSVPDYIDELYVIKNTDGIFTSSVIQISGKSAYYGGENKNTNDDPVDVLYGVNGSGDLFTVNPITGELVILRQLINGSYTCAVDRFNRKLYTVGKNKNLYVYDIDTDEIELVGYLGMGGPRLDFNESDGLLYFSTLNKLYSVDPSDATVLTQQSISGLHNTSGGDIKYGSDGTLYICTFSGLYRVIFDQEQASAVRISAESLPFKPTSMTIDSKGELWLASTNARLIVMDKVTGGWEYRFNTFDIAINDLATLPLDESGIPKTDTDGDGIIDFYDEFPDDANKAYSTYTPSIYGVGTLAFEDNWPAQGDYDFNDLVVNYQFITIANADDEVVELQCNYTIRHLGASYINGFGFELPFSESLIESVTGYNITDGIVSINGKGLEINQNNPVVIVCDNVNANAYQELDVIIKFIEPTASEVVGTPPFNPFMFVQQDRSREIHMSNYPPTSLANNLLFGTDDDTSDPTIGRYYKTINNLPWVIQTSHEFRYPKETIPINNGYLKFNSWSESGGTLFKDWYTDVSGYRDESKLKMPSN